MAELARVTNLLRPRSGPRPANRAAGILAGPGKALDATSRDSFEGRSGHDLSGIRVHDDPAAASLAESLGARAFTVGSDIAFGKGMYAPGTPAGGTLLAHEVAYAV